VKDIQEERIDLVALGSLEDHKDHREGTNLHNLADQPVAQNQVDQVVVDAEHKDLWVAVGQEEADCAHRTKFLEDLVAVGIPQAIAGRHEVPHHHAILEVVVLQVVRLQRLLPVSPHPQVSSSDCRHPAISDSPSHEMPGALQI
jgi:hypothetical protein